MKDWNFSTSMESFFSLSSASTFSFARSTISLARSALSASNLALNALFDSLASRLARSIFSSSTPIVCSVVFNKLVDSTNLFFNLGTTTTILSSSSPRVRPTNSDRLWSSINFVIKLLMGMAPNTLSSSSDSEIFIIDTTCRWGLSMDDCREDDLGSTFCCDILVGRPCFRTTGEMVTWGALYQLAQSGFPS